MFYSDILSKYFHSLPSDGKPLISEDLPMRQKIKKEKENYYELDT